jgi:hypothetical protein
MKKARFEPPLLVADAVVQETVFRTLWTFLTACPRAHHAHPARYLRSQWHFVLDAMQEHTQTLLYALHPASLALQALTTHCLAAFLNQTAPRVQQEPSTTSRVPSKGPLA